MTLSDAQQDMRHAYYNGAPGMFASALVWLAAGVVSLQGGPFKTTVLTLFVGGMLIHPAGVLFAKLLGRPGAHTSGNPLGALALESTILMILCLPLAYVVSLYRVDWFFPAMLLIIGGRYLVFATLFGMRLYWVLGAVLAMAAYALVSIDTAAAYGGFTGAGIEAVFAAVILVLAKRQAAS